MMLWIPRYQPDYSLFSLLGRHVSDIDRMKYFWVEPGFPERGHSRRCTGARCLHPEGGHTCTQR